MNSFEKKDESLANAISSKYNIAHDSQHFIIPLTLKSGKEITVYLPLWSSVPVGNSRERKYFELSDTKQENIEDLIEAHLKYLPEYEEDPGAFELLRRLKADRSGGK